MLGDFVCNAMRGHEDMEFTEKEFIAFCRRAQISLTTCDKCPNYDIKEEYMQIPPDINLVNETEECNNTKTEETKNNSSYDISNNKHYEIDKIFDDPNCPIKPFNLKTIGNGKFTLEDLVRNNLLKTERNFQGCRICKDTDSRTNNLGHTCPLCRNASRTKGKNKKERTGEDLIENLTKSVARVPQRMKIRKQKVNKGNDGEKNEIKENEKKNEGENQEDNKQPKYVSRVKESEILKKELRRIENRILEIFYLNVKDIFEEIKNLKTNRPLNELIKKLNELNEPLK
ncbi:hypothetical protein KAI92_02405 [Candidatus Parcubacteria bacterium]|nr:hypothetical protein [Candidatus Parcubacteria bacterium]